jgi:hypothetical protein
MASISTLHPLPLCGCFSHVPRGGCWIRPRPAPHPPQLLLPVAGQPAGPSHVLLQAPAERGASCHYRPTVGTHVPARSSPLYCLCSALSASFVRLAHTRSRAVLGAPPEVLAVLEAHVPVAFLCAFIRSSTLSTSTSKLDHSLQQILGVLFSNYARVRTCLAVVLATRALRSRGSLDTAPSVPTHQVHCPRVAAPGSSLHHPCR